MKMNRIAVLVLTGLLFFSIPCLAKSAEEGYQVFSVTFEQDGRIVNPNRHVINLQKKEFAIVVKFAGYRGEAAAIRLHASMNDNYYITAGNGMPVPDLLEDGIGLAEPAEVSRELYVTNRKAVQYLFVDSSRSRFHEVLTVDNAVIGKRYISGIHFPDGTVIPIENLAVNELYLVFVKRDGSMAQQDYYQIQFPKAELNPAERWLLQGIDYERKKDVRAAIDAYSNAVTINPQYYEAYLQRGKAYANLRKMEQAIADYSTAIGIDPKVTAGYILRGELYARMGYREQAIEDYTTAISIDPKNAAAFLQRGALYFDEKYTYRASNEDKMKALADFSQVIELEPANLRAYELRAGVYFSLKDDAKALADYDRAIFLAPNTIRLYEKRAICHRLMGSWEKEWEDRNKLVELNPQNPIAYSNRAIAGKQSATDMNQVIADFTKVIEMYQGQADKLAGLATAYYNRGEAFRAGGKKEEAIADFTTAIALKPNYVILYDSRGAAYFEKGDYDRAIADCAQAIELYRGNGSPWTYLVRGKAYKAKGMNREALADFNKALIIQPDFEEAEIERASLQ
jgi:tetratricopeptide (TPR) repeat protein